MKIDVETSPLKIAVKGCITEAMQNKEFGIKLGFKSEEDDMRSEVVLTPEHARDLVSRINYCLGAIENLSGDLVGRYD